MTRFTKSLRAPPSDCPPLRAIVGLLAVGSALTVTAPFLPWVWEQAGGDVRQSGLARGGWVSLVLCVAGFVVGLWGVANWTRVGRRRGASAACSLAFAVALAPAVLPVVATRGVRPSELEVRPDWGILPALAGPLICLVAAVMLSQRWQCDPAEPCARSGARGAARLRGRPRTIRRVIVVGTAMTIVAAGLPWTWYNTSLFFSDETVHVSGLGRGGEITLVLGVVGLGLGLWGLYSWPRPHRRRTAALLCGLAFLGAMFTVARAFGLVDDIGTDQVGTDVGPLIGLPGAAIGVIGAVMLFERDPAIHPLGSSGGVVQVLLWSVAAVAAVASGHHLAAASAFEDYRATPAYSDFTALEGGGQLRTGRQLLGIEKEGIWADADDRATAAGGWLLLVWTAAFIVLVVWMHKAHRSTDRLGPGPRTWGSGWAVAGWFIPVANLVIPKLVFNEIERIATAPRTNDQIAGRWQHDPTSRAGWAWWIGLLGAVALIAMSTALIDPGFDGSTRFDVGWEASPDTIRTSYWLAVAGYASWTISAICGASLVRRTTRRLL